MEGDQNKRATKGTEHTLSTSQKIGGEFKREKNSAFIKERAAIWDKYYKISEENKSKIEKQKISITLKDGKIIEGKSFETTPMEIGKTHYKNQQQTHPKAWNAI